MYISLKYVVLYVGAGAATGYFSDGNKLIGAIGVGVAAIVGASFGIQYGVLSAIEFAVGLGIAALVKAGSSGSKS